MYSSIRINLNDADDIIMGFAIALRDGVLTLSEVQNFILESLDNDEALTQIVFEKTLFKLEAMKMTSFVPKVALA